MPVSTYGGAKSNRVAQIQDMLNRGNFAQSRLVVDGIYGSKTKAAVARLFAGTGVGARDGSYVDDATYTFLAGVTGGSSATVSGASGGSYGGTLGAQAGGLFGKAVAGSGGGGGSPAPGGGGGGGNNNPPPPPDDDEAKKKKEQQVWLMVGLGVFALVLVMTQGD